VRPDRFCPFKHAMRVLPAIPMLLAGVAAAMAAAPPQATDLAAAYDRGAVCLAGRMDRPDLGDPYLAYVYPAEALPGAGGGRDDGGGGDGGGRGGDRGGRRDDGNRERLTYRQADARIMLAMVARAAGAGAPLAAEGREAEASLAAAAPAWKRAGLADMAKGPEAGGVALDTFCIVGWLLGDRAMAATVADAVKDDAWLPEGLYDGEQAFRRSADECWCLRMLAEASPPFPTPSPVAWRIASTLGRSASMDPGGRGVFYEALHLGMALEKAEPAFAPAAREAAAALMGWARAHAGDETRGRSLPEWINLASAAWLDPLGGAEARAAALARVVASQDADGCWRLPGAEPADYASSFVTLRALLALAPYRLVASAAREEEDASDEDPAPKAARPAQ
jgi:hypothetical protein